MTCRAVFRSMFNQTLAVLEDEQASASERFAAEEALTTFIRVLKDDERCITDLLAYVARAIHCPRPRSRHAYVAAAALRAISNPDRGFEAACRVLGWASAAGDDPMVFHLLEFHFTSHLRRCDVDPVLIQRGYEVSVQRRLGLCYLRSLVSCRIKDESWLRCFVERELKVLEREPQRFEYHLRPLRDFVTALMPARPEVEHVGVVSAKTRPLS